MSGECQVTHVHSVCTLSTHYCLSFQAAGRGFLVVLALSIHDLFEGSMCK